MKWRKLQPIVKPIFQGCLNCSPTPLAKLQMLNTFIGINSIDEWLLKNDKNVDLSEWFSDNSMDDSVSLMRIENRIRKDSDHDWRIFFNSGLHDETYQRQDKNLWVLVIQGKGYA